MGRFLGGEKELEGIEGEVVDGLVHDLFSPLFGYEDSFHFEVTHDREVSPDDVLARIEVPLDFLVQLERPIERLVDSLIGKSWSLLIFF